MRRSGRRWASGSSTPSHARSRQSWSLALSSREVPKAAAPAAGTQGSEAKSILKAMSDYVGSLKTIELTFDSDIEVITPQLEKIQFTNSGDALLSRPDKLHAHRVGGYAEVELFFDGKTASVFGKSLNGYAQFEAPGTVDKLFEALRAGHGVALPFADLLLSNSYDALVAGVEEAKYMGRGVIHGTECEHLAFRNFDTDWQLWVEMGKAPFPRKMVITSKTVARRARNTPSASGAGKRASSRRGTRSPSLRRPERKSSIPTTSSSSTSCRRAAPSRGKAMTHATRRYLLTAGLAAAGWVFGGAVEAWVGRPATPVSYAGVARRSTVGVGAPGVGAAPMNRGGPVNRVGVR